MKVIKAYPKPHKTRREFGLTLVVQMVAPDIRSILDLMNNSPGCFILTRGMSSAFLLVPNQPKLKVYPKNIEPLCGWLQGDEVVVDGYKRWILLPETMQYIRRMEQ